MHDIDRTMMEFEGDNMNGYVGESEMEYEYNDEYDDEYEYEYDEYEAEYSDTEVFNEEEEMDLAAELLAVTDEAELDQFLGSLIKKAGRKIRKFVKPGTGRALGRILKGAAKKALTIIGGAVGTAFGGPAGGAVGGKLASTAGRLFGLELEGLSPEDQEFEVAKRVVRLAGAATQKAAMAPGNISWLARWPKGSVCRWPYCQGATPGSSASRFRARHGSTAAPHRPRRSMQSNTPWPSTLNAEMPYDLV